MKIDHKSRWLIYSGFFTVIYGFFIVLALLLRILWLSPILVLLFASGILIPIYFRHQHRHSNKAEKQRMIAQKAINSYYYNRWYTPADLTELDYQIEKIKKRKKPIK
jgi:hypothetical protein